MATASILQESTYTGCPVVYKNDYKEIKLLGEGNFGQVYEVIHKIDNKLYAIKKMLVDGSYNELTKSIGKNSLQIQREVSSLTKLKSDYIVKYFNSWREDKWYYIKLEKCDTDLRKILDKKSKIFGRQESDDITMTEYIFSLEIMKETTTGLMFLHSKGHMHRDIKPENIMINFNSQNHYVKIGDFGLTVFHEVRKSFHKHTKMVGTLKYMAPEAHDEFYDFKADVYSLAIVASELFNKCVFEGDYKFDEIIKDKSKILNEIIKKMMITPEFKERYSCEQILKKLDRLNIDKKFILKSDEYKNIELNRNNSEIDGFIFQFISEKINSANYKSIKKMKVFNSIRKKFSLNHYKASTDYFITPEPIVDVRLATINSDVSVDSSITIERNEIDVSYQIGQGTFGKVFSGVWNIRSGRVKVNVAIKISNVFDHNNIQIFLEEALIMKNFDNKNVMGLYGVTFDVHGTPMIVLPFMRNGDLLSYLRDDSNRPTVGKLIDFAIDAARGLEYLAGRNLIHRDIAARNCMINDDMRVIIADFGLSKHMKKDYYRTDMIRPMPIRWMAIESIEKAIFTMKSDIWSYGVLVWEIFTRGVIPYTNLRNNQIYYYLQCGSRLIKPEFCPNSLYEMISNCWSAEPDERPTFTNILQIIDQTLDYLKNKRVSIQDSSSMILYEKLWYCTGIQGNVQSTT